ncbi:MAG TPA: CRISPR system precrRNA processing endoribonuclease RAMP protein Cas6 [Gammaproteobacteria bacterium]|nr:CRISPR system precrRNA processing endoribonuclease RAMP protein Cas6 [Gammaproteobacteria bacterium]
MTTALAVAKYRFRMVAASEIVLPEYKGSAFHGGFGHALRKIAPSWYRHLFEPGPPGNGPPHTASPPGNAWPKPFVLLPPLDEEHRYPKDHPFECELTLFGPAIQYYPICHAALEYLGATLGLGENRGKFRVDGVDIARIDPAAVGSAPIDHAISSTEIASARQGVNTRRLALHYVTRLRLKAGNRLHREAPPFPMFLARLLGRLNTLANLYGDGELIQHPQRSELQQRAEQITIEQHDTCWDDWSRYSGRQKEWMKFGGLLGSVTYVGDMAPFLPWLALGEWVHVGGKSSFGFGKYEITPDHQPA